MNKKKGTGINMSKLYIIMYHYVRDLAHSRFPEIKGLDVGLFKKQIEFLKSKFSIVRMEEVMEAARGKSPLPERAALLTFDDGYIDHYTYVLPILENGGGTGLVLHSR